MRVLDPEPVACGLKISYRVERFSVIAQVFLKVEQTCNRRVSLLLELFVDQLFAATGMFNGVTAFVKQGVVKLQTADAIGYAGYTSISPVDNMMNL